MNFISLNMKKEYKLGTRKINEEGQQYKYVKIDFGVIGKVNNKVYRHIRYGWLPMGSLYISLE